MHPLPIETPLARPSSNALEPIRLFDVDALGISFDTLRRRIAPTFRELPWDEYDVRRAQVKLLTECFPQEADRLAAFLPEYFAGQRELTELHDLVAALSTTDRLLLERIQPCRRRSIATFVVRKTRDHRWDIERQPDEAFSQASDHDHDYRRFERRFAPSPAAVTEVPEYRKLLVRLAQLTDEVRDGELSALRIVCHQMGLVATPDGASNAPEGIHQDGADYIVSALVIERRNVSGGESVVYGADQRTEHLRHTLLEGQGLFQADAGSSLWHSVTPIRPTHPDASRGVRSILGYDIHVL